ncbi:hypothetical protein IG195_03515 [Arthrobacter sp. TES]|jgi:hypothetical protein|uniref:DUF4383 domain-containing protein n=1 Tax=Paenarthrobacter ureafaciens TaxID=37931 RepID=A0AAX3EKJ1_PAEUR|nr:MULTISPECIES: hypothetical protein [Paenarthrobacter]AMB39536.1 hypothetical protein AUT26_04420 [Arthrobacter sp. ATCC 21022]AOY72523.1 hypothetical protein ARZXY2_2999 [Arthrobacter sp. ZXY-2]ERI36412.1 hypothetical protein M707_16955 [Arthrobacter sp. AK-YN10]NKR11111.1 hypothetical protein [Arthrobacter sp. M5]NKR15317.1 hypothetical protein [Arthrobacter sp. M6]OEH59278.1 hypothetical protein A5N13_20055 [Arthrobacter sp. D4]OEH59380.1 hypothetical protein A5N17_18550 [Arthrobacter s
MRKTLMVLAAIVLLSSLAQLFFAGYFHFQNTIEAQREAGVYHVLNGQYVLRYGALLAAIVAAIARMGSRTIWLAAGIFLMTWVQLFIFIIGGMLTGSSEDFITPSGSWVASIHPITGLLIIFMSYWLFSRARAAALNPQPLPPKDTSSDAPTSPASA